MPVLQSQSTFQIGFARIVKRKVSAGERVRKEKLKWHKTHFVCPRCKKIILVEYKSKELINNWYVH